MKYLSLFSGIGGFELGIQQAYELSKVGTKSKNSTDGKSEPSQHWERPFCIGYSEIDKYAMQVYQTHFPNHKNYGDIKTIDATKLPDFDFLCGGFPCQSFSIAGKRKGFTDTRGTLFFEIARILKEKQPRLFLLENVKGLLSHDNGNTFKTIISTLDELGYDLQWQVLNSKNFGVPQNRERVFIVGHLRGTRRPEVFPIGAGDKVDDQVREVEDKEGARSSCLNTRYGQRWTDETYIGKGAKIRRLTPLECERLQGFPDNWTQGISDTQRYKCCGNAVTVNVIQAIMERL
jgi:DNA (cytosine-5)-methyltransferase 1